MIDRLRKALMKALMQRKHGRKAMFTYRRQPGQSPIGRGKLHRRVLAAVGIHSIDGSRCCSYAFLSEAWSI